MTRTPTRSRISNEPDTVAYLKYRFSQGERNFQVLCQELDELGCSASHVAINLIVDRFKIGVVCVCPVCQPRRACGECGESKTADQLCDPSASEPHCKECAAGFWEMMGDDPCGKNWQS